MHTHAAKHFPECLQLGTLTIVQVQHPPKASSNTLVQHPSKYLSVAERPSGPEDEEILKGRTPTALPAAGPSVAA